MTRTTDNRKKFTENVIQQGLFITTAKAPFRLAVLITHPIQYYAPVFRRLAVDSRIQIHVFYGWKGLVNGGHDPGFGTTIAWDVPLLDGYPYTFLQNVSSDPGSHHSRGIDCPDAALKIGAWAPDAILVYGWRYRSHLAVIRHFSGKLPIYFRGDSTLLDERLGIRTWIRRMALKWVYRHIDAALYVGSNNRAYFVAHGLDESQLFFAPHAIDNEYFADNAKAESDALQWRRELGIGDNQIVLLFVGKLEHKKAPETLQVAFNRLDDPNVQLIFAGAGPMESELRAAANARTHFIGFQNQSRMPTTYRLADVVVLPSRGPSETWGLAINEAMACGKTVVASDRVGCAIDLIQPGTNGWIFQADNIRSLSSVLNSIATSNRGILAEMGSVSHSSICEWSIAKQCDAIAKAFLDRLPRSLEKQTK